MQTHIASEEETSKAMQTYREVSRTGIPTKIITNELLRKDGTTYSAELSISSIRNAEGKPTGFRIISRDVTDRIKMERELERYKEFVENVDDGCFETSIDGKLIFVNEALCRHSGYTREELYEASPGTRYASKEERRRVFPIFMEIYNTGVFRKLIDQ